MKLFAIYEHVSGPEEDEAVKLGFSWPAFFFDWIWAFTKRLPRHGAALLAVSISFLFLDDAFPGDGPASEAVGALWLAYSIAVGAYANKWRQSNLSARGYEEVERLEASSAQEALSIASEELQEPALLPDPRS